MARSTTPLSARRPSANTDRSGRGGRPGAASRVRDQAAGARAAGDRILEEMRDGQHDLVVMGSRGRGDVRSLVLGSVSYQLLNAGPADVLIVHAEADGEGSTLGPQTGAALE